MFSRLIGKLPGQLLMSIFDDRNAMIGKTLAERLNLGVGSKLKLSKNSVEKHEFTIKGIVEAGDATEQYVNRQLRICTKLVG